MFTIHKSNALKFIKRTYFKSNFYKDSIISFGANENAQCGHLNLGNIMNPTRVPEIPADMKFINIAAGWRHTIAHNGSFIKIFFRLI